MPDGEFELREIDWTVPRVGVVGLMLVVATLHLALAATLDQSRYAVLALGLLVCFVLYFTDLWRPSYNLAGALYVCGMAAVWVVSGSPMTPIGYLDTGLKVALVGLFVYLLVSERRNVDPAE
jgi:MFS superfamily sulfate permease-like transporter